MTDLDDGIMAEIEFNDFINCSDVNATLWFNRHQQQANKSHARAVAIDTFYYCIAYKVHYIIAHAICMCVHKVNKIPAGDFIETSQLNNTYMYHK